MPSTYLPVTKFEKYKSHRYWLYDNPYFTYNNILVSPFVTGLDRSRKDFKDATIYADSGGYQIATQGLQVKAMDVLHWQENIADIAFTVDVPPHSFGDDFTHDQFLISMKKSNENADLMWRFKVNNDMELWGVIQGRTFDECKLWYDDLTKDHDYDGYCISLSIHKSGTKIPWIEQLRFAKTISKRIHFLGSGSTIFALILARFSKVMKKTYTYDTSSPTAGVRWAKYMIPETFNQISFSNKERPIDKLPCACPICTKYSVTDLRYNLPLVMLHNLYVQISFCELANSLTDEQFYSYLDNLVRNESEKSKIIGLLE